jgi:hypothetical protein
MKKFIPAKVAAMIIESDNLYRTMSEKEDLEVSCYYGMLSQFKGSKELQKLKKQLYKITDQIYLIAKDTDPAIWDRMVKEYNLCGDSWSWITFEFDV